MKLNRQNPFCYHSKHVPNGYLGLCSLSGRSSYRKISRSLEATIVWFRLFQSLWNLQEPRQQRCRDACQISERYEHYTIQSRGFETSRDLTVRRPLVFYSSDRQNDASRLNAVLRDRAAAHGTKTRPISDFNQPIDLKFGLRLIQVEIKEEYNIMKISAWVRQVIDSKFSNINIKYFEHPVLNGDAYAL